MNNPDKIKILYVDDEPNNLNSFKASYRFDYNIFTAASVDEAILLMEKEPDFVVVISDQRMPGKTGSEFFESIRFKYPKPVRILLTGYADIEDVVSAINKGHIFRYIRKPWVDADLLSAIEEAKKYYMAHSMLMERNESLQKAYSELDRFAYRVTHDLRGPIINTLAALDMVKVEKDETARNEVVDLITKSMLKLDAFVEQMFAYYKIRHGEIDIQPIDFEKLVKTQLDIFGVTIKLHKIRFEYTIEQDVQFMSDEVKCTIILSNLLSNALKYQKAGNPDKWVNLNIRVEDGQAMISVSDNGIGIAEQFQQSIFDLFYRATTSEPGAGIGLYNVHDALLKLNGKIEVKSELNVGTTFNLTIPGKM